MSTKWDNKKKPVVIVGAGGAGSALARSLSQTLDRTKYELVLINPRPLHVVLPTTVRMLVTTADNLDKTALIPYDKLFVNENGTFKLGKVQSVSSEGAEGGEVVLESGEHVPYYILVLASGSHWPGPTTYPDTTEGVKEHVDSWRQDVKNAQNIVLIGGGAVGVGTSRPYSLIMDTVSDAHSLCRNRWRDQD